MCRLFRHGFLGLSLIKLDSNGLHLDSLTPPCTDMFAGFHRNATLRVGRRMPLAYLPSGQSSSSRLYAILRISSQGFDSRGSYWLKDK